jgi:hypothetical protein
VSFFQILQTSEEFCNTKDQQPGAVLVQQTESTLVQQAGAILAQQTGAL